MIWTAMLAIDDGLHRPLAKISLLTPQKLSHGSTLTLKKDIRNSEVFIFFYFFNTRARTC